MWREKQPHFPMRSRCRWFRDAPAKRAPRFAPDSGWGRAVEAAAAAMVATPAPTAGEAPLLAELLARAAAQLSASRASKPSTLVRPSKARSRRQSSSGQNTRLALPPRRRPTSAARRPDGSFSAASGAAAHTRDRASAVRGGRRCACHPAIEAPPPAATDSRAAIGRLFRLPHTDAPPPRLLQAAGDRLRTQRCGPVHSTKYLMLRCGAERPHGSFVATRQLHAHGHRRGPGAQQNLRSNLLASQAEDRVRPAVSPRPKRRVGPHGRRT